MADVNNSDLMNQLIQWAQQGGGNATTNYIGSNGNGINQIASPQIAADAAQSISGGQQGNGGNFSGGNMNTPQMPNILPQQQQKQHPQALPLNPDQQKGVQQAIKAKQKADQQQGMQWGMQALQSGLQPQDILNHNLMGNVQPGNTPMAGGQIAPPMNPQQILQKILPQGQAQPSVFSGGGNPAGGASGSWGGNNTQVQSKPPVQNAPQPQAKQNALTAQPSIQSLNDKTAFNVASQNEKESEPKNFFERWQQQFQKMSGGMTQADRLSNLGAMQKLAGAEPLQKKDVSEMTAGTYRAAIDGASKLVDADSSKFKDLTSMYGQMNETKGFPNKALSLPSDEQKQVMDSLRQTAQRLNNHLKNMGTLLDNRPSFNTQGVNANQENIKDKITGKTQNGISYSVVK